MARARNIKPGFYKNEDLAECSIWARYIFPGLWMLADRDGRLEDRPKRIKGELLPFDSQDVEPLLAELATKKDERGVPFIVRYRNSDGAFIQISKFSTHQTPHYSEKKSVIKPPEFRESEADSSGENSGSLDAMKGSALPEHSGNSPPIKRGSQPPDSLIHRFSDSLNPESLVPNPLGGGGDSTSSTGQPPPNRAAAIAVLLIKREKSRGKHPKITSIHPTVQGWAKQGITDEQIEAAYEIALADRMQAGDESPINPGFLDVFLAKILNPPGGAQTRVNGQGKPWFIDSWSAIVAKGAEKGLREPDFDTSPEFRDAVFEAFGITADQVRQAEADWRVAA